MTDHVSDKIKWLSVSELAELTKKSESTIKRIAKKLSIKAPAAVRHEGKKIFINIDLYNDIMTDHVTDSDRSLTDHVTDHVSDIAGGDMLQILKEQLSEKDKQINSLTERLREQNIIIANMLQERQLKLPEPTERKRTFLQWFFNK
jgi:hypothetical protein